MTNDLKWLGHSAITVSNPGQKESSRNNEIDNLILEAQHKTKHYDDNLEWIDYNKFQDIKLVGEGGFAKIYSATWSDEIKPRHIKVALKKTLVQRKLLLT